MTSERLLNMSIEVFIPPQKFLYSQNKFLATPLQNTQKRRQNPARRATPALK